MKKQLPAAGHFSTETLHLLSQKANYPPMLAHTHVEVGVHNINKYPLPIN